MESLCQRMESRTHPRCQNPGHTFRSGKETHHHSLEKGKEIVRNQILRCECLTDRQTDGRITMVEVMKLIGSAKGQS